MASFKLLLPPCCLCKPKRSVDNPWWEKVEECLVLPMGMGWRKLVPGKSLLLVPSPPWLVLQHFRQDTVLLPHYVAETLSPVQPGTYVGPDTWDFSDPVHCVTNCWRREDTRGARVFCPKGGDSLYAWISNTWKAAVNLHIRVFLTSLWWLSLRAYALHPGAGIKELVFLC